jgi:2-methylisocitrate lyase-like PEP mutase family enzyme
VPNTKADRFRTLHASGCFVTPNPWDPGSARILEQLGFLALASTSAGFAFSRGLPDSVSALSCDAVLAHLKELCAATTLPVSADFQDGYAANPAGVARNVARCVETGVAGLSIEDATGDAQAPLYEREVAIERVRAARAAIDASGIPLVLTARCEAWLVGHPDAEHVARDRLVAYAEAGADCLFAPGVPSLPQIGDLVRAVAPRPLNAIVTSGKAGLTVTSLAEVGVRRISVGSALARVALRAFIDAARGISGSGRFETLDAAAPFAELNAIFAG